MRIFSLFALLLLACALSATPNRPEPKKAEPPPALPWTGETNWGTLALDGRKVTITGHVRWSAVGEVRKDGKLLLMWFNMPEGDECGPGLYELRALPERQLIGVWGYAGNLQVGADGELEGSKMSDRIYHFDFPPDE